MIHLIIGNTKPGRRQRIQMIKKIFVHHFSPLIKWNSIFLPDKNKLMVLNGFPGE
jgi:hypothetical protein